VDKLLGSYLKKMQWVRDRAFVQSADSQNIGRRSHDILSLPVKRPTRSRVRARVWMLIIGLITCRNRLAFSNIECRSFNERCYGHGEFTCIVLYSM